MASTERKGNAFNKLSDVFNNKSPKIRTNRSASVPKNKENELNKNIKHRAPQTTTGYTTHSKAFIFDESDNDSEENNLSSPKSIHRPQNSLNLEQNPLASKQQIQQLANSHTNPSSQPNPLSNVTVVNIENMLQEMDSEKVNINIKNSDDEYSSSFDGLADNTGMDIHVYPPGYTSPSNKDDKYKRRKSNRKDIWRMMQSVVDGVGTLGRNAMNAINEDLYTPDDIKYNNKGYETVTKNNELFKHNEYKIQRRFSSHEVWNSRYTSKCYRRKNRPRSKSDPLLLPFTKRFYRKLEGEYRPGTMNIFTMKSEKKEKEITYPTRAHQDSIHFRYLFDDSDFEDDSLADWSDDELDSLLRSYDIEVHDTTNTMDEHKTDFHNRKFTDKLSSINLNKLKELNLNKIGKGLGKGIDKIKSVKDLNVSNTKVPIKPYGGHVEASESMIMKEFGSTVDHIMQYNVKKKNKLGRDKTRIAVLDIPLQVLRMKDKNGKTHKEHIVSSISDHAIIGEPQTATQIIIKFHDNRDYHLTFDSNKQCIQFRDLIEKLRKFNLKMISKPNNSNNRNKLTMTPGMTVGNHDISTRDKRTNSLNLNASMGSDIGYFDDDDEISMSQSTHPTNGHLQIKRNRTRERFDTDMFDNLMDDGNVYTGMATSNVVYRIIKINKWGTKKERTMIVHKTDRTVRLFDDKRRCHSEYPLKIMATLDIIDALNVEVVFVIDQKPTQFVFRSHIDLWDFVEQIRTIAPNEIMVNDRRMGNSNKAMTISANKNAKILKSTKDMLFIDVDGGDKVMDAVEDKVMGFEELDVNPNVLRYSVLRLIRSQAKRNQDITWRQHRRVLYLDLEKRIVRMLTLGMHIKDYKFEDILLLEKSYINVNQLHMTCKHINKIKEYWYEFVSPQARAEFVGRLLRALPGTKQSINIHSLNINSNPLVNHNSESKEDNYKPQIDIYADSIKQDTLSTHPDVSMQRTLSPRNKKKKRRKRLSSEALRGLVSGDDGKVVNKSTTASPLPKEEQQLSYGNLDVSALDEHEMNGIINENMTGTISLDSDNKSKHFTQDPLSIIVGSWNVSESEINFANLNMWIPPSKIEPHDIYVIGLQECAPTLRKQWVTGILRHIDSGRNEYVLLNKEWLMGIGIIIIVHRCHVTKISHLHSQVVPTGKGNIIGNKGATAISFQFQETSFVFINAHLAARAEKFEKRAKNFNRIIKNLCLGRPGLDVLHQFTHTFFIGDLNYRIEKDFYETVEMVKKKKWNDLVRSDQLRYQMDKNQVFYGFKEGEINFCPTYRWERQKNTISNKREQPPSYCDRILYKSLPQTYDLWQECYLSSHRCFGSDHRPVWSLFKFKPKMPYFTLSSHDINIANDNENKTIKKSKEQNIKKIEISLVELQASIRVSNNSKNKKILIHLEDEIDIILHYKYASKPIRIKGGKFDKTSAVWRWPIETLDSLKIKPFIPDPKFIARTHLFVSFINTSKGNLCIGYSIISLFNAFPKSLIDTNKLIKEYKKIEKQMNLMQSKFNNNNEINSIMDTQSGNKQFNIPILLYGNYCGNLSGFVYADGAVVDKHRKITNFDLLAKYEKEQQQSTKNVSIFQRASDRFINHKK